MFTVFLKMFCFYRDNTVYRLLSQALESPATADIRRSAFHSNCASRDDLRSRVGTKTPLGEYMSCLFETAAFMVASRDTVQNLLQAGCIAMLRDSRKTAPGGGLFLSLITILSKYCPQSFEGSSAHVQNWLSHSIQGSNDARRRSLSQSSRFQLADKDSTLLLLTITKLSSAYIWREQLVDQASGRKTVPKTLRTDGAVEESSALCEALLGWCKTCSDSKACYALSEVPNL